MVGNYCNLFNQKMSCRLSVNLTLLTQEKNYPQCDQ